MNNISGYIGKVDVTYFEKDKFVYKEENINSGTVDLFKYIANLLSGNYAAKTLAELAFKRPGKLELKDSLNNTIVVTYNGIKPTNSAGLLDDSWASFTLQFLIPSSILNSGQIFTKLALLSQDGLNKYAEIDTELIISSNNSSLLVEWNLTFCNK